MENIPDGLKVDYDSGQPEAQVRAVIQLLSENPHHSQAHDMVLTALGVCVTSLETPTEEWLLTLVELVVALPLSASTLPLLLSAVETGLSVCLTFGATTPHALHTVTPHLSHPLASLFKAAYSQLKNATGMLDSLTDSDHCLHPTLTALLKVAAVVTTNFDPSIVALCWRSLGRGLPKLSNSELAEQIVCQLCTSLETAYGEASGEKGVKLVVFMGNLLCQFVREPGLWSEKPVVDCLLSVLNGERLLEPAFTLTQNLLSVLAHQRASLELLLAVSPLSQHSLGRLLVICNLIPLLPQLQEEQVKFCLEPYNGTCRMLASLFTCISQCYVWFQLPLRVPGFKALDRLQRSVTLSEYVSCSLCLLCTTVPCQYVDTIESSLLRGVLSSIPHLALLAMDTLVYHIRRCSEVVVQEYIELIQQLLSQVSSMCLSALLHRLKRLLHHYPSLPQQSSIIATMSVVERTEAQETALVTSLLQQCPPNGMNCSEVARSFRHLIASPSWLVHTLALEAFRSLAKVSVDTGFVESCVPSGYTEAVLQFLHKRDSESWPVSSVKIGLEQQEKNYHAQILQFIITFTLSPQLL